MYRSQRIASSNAMYAALSETECYPISLPPHYHSFSANSASSLSLALNASLIRSASRCSISLRSNFARSLSLCASRPLFSALPDALFAGLGIYRLPVGPGLIVGRKWGSASPGSDSEEPGLRIDFMELRRFEFVDEDGSARELTSPRVSSSEKERFLEGDRNELGDSEGCL